MIHPLDDARHRIEVLTPTCVHPRSDSNPSHRRYWQNGYQEGIRAALRNITDVRHASHIKAHSIATSWSSAIRTATWSEFGPIPSGVSHQLIEDALNATTDYEHTRALKAIVNAYASVLDHLTDPHSQYLNQPPYGFTVSGFGFDPISPLDYAHRQIRRLTSRPYLDGAFPRHWHHSRRGFAQAASDALTKIEVARQVSHRNSYTITVLWSPRHLRKLRHQLSDPLASHIRSGMLWPPRSSQLSIGPLPVRISHRLIEDALDATTDSQRTHTLKAITTAYASIVDRLTEPLTLPCDFPYPDPINPSTHQQRFETP